jgi:hypothetical protein
MAQLGLLVALLARPVSGAVPPRRHCRCHHRLPLGTELPVAPVATAARSCALALRLRCRCHRSHPLLLAPPPTATALLPRDPEECKTLGLLLESLTVSGKPSTDSSYYQEPNPKPSL